GAGPGNVGSIANISFKIDNVAPTGSISYPSANASISSATVVMTGAATDELAGVQTIQVEISTGSGSKSYWTGSTWTAAGTQLWIGTTTANPWFYTISSGALVSGNIYYLRLQLTDAAGNPFTSQISTFTYDTQPPTIGISTPLTGNFYSQVQ